MLIITVIIIKKNSAVLNGGEGENFLGIKVKVYSLGAVVLRVP